MATIEKRENADGSTSYRVKIRLKGFPQQMATFERLTDARKWVQHTESAIREGRHFKTAASKKHTLSELLGKYRGIMTPKNLADRRHILEFWDSRLGAYSLADIGPAMIADVRDFMKDGRAPATITKYLVTLSHAFTYADRKSTRLNSSH